MCAIRAWAFLRAICRAFSNGFIAWIRRARAPPAAPVWDWLLSSTRWNRWAGRFRWRAASGRGRYSQLRCRPQIVTRLSRNFDLAVTRLSLIANGKPPILAVRLMKLTTLTLTVFVLCAVHVSLGNAQGGVQDDAAQLK